MDSKPPVSSLCQFKETRSSLQPLQSSPVIQIQIPSSSTFSVRSRQQRRILRTFPTFSNEEAHRSNYLATIASFYFGRSKRHPQSFLWRVLGDGKVLEVRSADISKSSHEKREAFLTLQLSFPTTLKRGCIALADATDQDDLTIFALTKGNELYTIILRKDFFCHPAASEEDVPKWCKISKPATFSVSTPHTLIASSPLQLVVSLSDGRLLLLQRDKGDDGSKWIETTYGDGQWAASLRGLVPWRGSNTIKYDGTVLEQGTPITLAVSPDKSHIFAVCLNHTLRIWNTKKASNVFSMDLLWEHHEPHEIPRLTLDPGNPNVLQMFQSDGAVEGDLYYAVTFSPHDFGQFKFWGIRDPDHGEQGVRDLFPEYPLKPPDPDPSPESKAIWKVVDFKVNGGKHGKRSDIWILMRANRRCKLYSLKFDVLDLAVVWQDQWVAMAFETKDEQAQPQISDLDAQDVTDKWLNFIFEPGKYPDPVLETALGVYCSERSITLPNAKFSLQQRMSVAITSQIKCLNSENNLESYRNTNDQEWTAIWQDIRDLDKARWDFLSLAYDSHTEMPWLAYTGGCSAVRTCDKIELISQNRPVVLAESVGMLESPSVEMEEGTEPMLPDELAVIIDAAATFRRTFSCSLRQVCNSLLTEELWLDASHSVSLRIQSFYDRCNFAEEIGSAAFDELRNALAPIGGFNGLETDVFLAILDEFQYHLPEESSGWLHTSYGRHLLINGAQESVYLRRRMLFDLIVLIVFVEMEIDREEMPMENFDAAQIYVRLLDLLKQYQISEWLVEHTRIVSDVRSLSLDEHTLGDSLGRTSTILECLFAFDLPASSLKTQTQSESLTSSINDLLQWVIGGNENLPLDDVPVYIQTYLLANNELDLASDFLQYQPSTAWSTYIKGRLSLLKGDSSEAALYFKKVAFKISRPSSFDYHNASHSLLSNMESLSFGNGLPTYYTHILNLFDSHSHPTQMADFAHLALQLIPPPHRRRHHLSIRPDHHPPHLPFPSLPPNHRFLHSLLSSHQTSESRNPPPKSHLRPPYNPKCTISTPVTTIPASSPLANRHHPILAKGQSLPENSGGVATSS